MREIKTGTDAVDPLSDLEVIDRLEIGPVRLEPKRLVAPYRLLQDGREASTELIYSYDEKVFDPADKRSYQLASMISIQVALNYGLFCRSIHFHGEFDETDRRLIREAAENTCREIYVKKFLEPNPFLVGKVRSLPVVKQKSYLRSELVFGDPPTTEDTSVWEGSSDRYAVLSSGGKDSLLTYGLIQELGAEVHPIFCNESGRHWFTALNGYRYFKQNVDHTARVWMNSDRVFAWMLRHLPFVRRDFASLRSDEYPVRLWTVAVFLFGALPLLRKRKIGRLLVGDEYDTTQRTDFEGILHFDGLYDQSRYFDNQLTRYFLRKGWGIQQFSVLRPLSELFIQKVLVERYPKLQAQQISCHAAHKEGERVRPCGKCEKCRRIVAMLKAIDADPSRCGYTETQVGRCLQDFPSKGIHQERAGVRHLTWLLAERGLIDFPKGKVQSVKPQAEVMALRFDRSRSPFDCIPSELRKPLYQVLLEHGEGGVKRSGRIWVAFDPLSPESLSPPYRFSRADVDDLALERSPNSCQLGVLTWPEAKERFKAVDVALLPVGSIEQHGPHLPLDTDAFDADFLAHQVALRCTDPKPIVLPLIPYGVSYHHDDFSGTIGISNETLSKLVYEIGMGVARNGVTKLVIINGHGGNDPALNFAAQMINRDARIFTCVDSGETSDVDIYALIDTPNDVHAGEIETSTSLALREGLVRKDKVEKYIPRFSSRYLNFTSRRGVSWYAYTQKISNSGVMGDPTKASAEKGQRIWKLMIDHLVTFVEDLKGLTLDEIHQRRY